MKTLRPHGGQVRHDQLRAYTGCVRHPCPSYRRHPKTGPGSPHHTLALAFAAADDRPSAGATSGTVIHSSGLDLSNPLDIEWMPD